LYFYSHTTTPANKQQHYQLQTTNNVCDLMYQQSGPSKYEEGVIQAMVKKMEATKNKTKKKKVSIFVVVVLRM